jgi:FlaA1/EpsC-like NDP-sugar epimerase
LSFSLFDLNNLADSILETQPNLTSSDTKRFEGKIKETYSGKTIFIIGAAGFIATQTIFELVKYSPKELILIDTNENGLAELIRSLRTTFQQELLPKLNPILFDITDNLILQIADNYEKLDFIFNFSASKHVRTERDNFSLWRMIDTNINGIRNVILMADKSGAKVFSISSDKASNPTNFMGFTKRLMEILLFRGLPDTSFTTRFANVLFSSGSLTESWMIRLQKNQPLAVPRDTSRFFIRPKESGQLCVLAPTVITGGEILIPNLNLNNSLSLKTVLEKFLSNLDLNPLFIDSEIEAIDLSASKFGREIPIIYTKRDTAGEKDSEEFFNDNDVIKVISKDLSSISNSTQSFDYSLIDTYLDFLDEIKINKKKLPSLDKFFSESTKVLTEFKPIRSQLRLDDRI